MNLYTPMSRRERAAVAIVSGTVSLSLLTGLLVLFNDGRMPWLGPDPSAVLAASPPAAVTANAAPPQARHAGEDITARVASR